MIYAMLLQKPFGASYLERSSTHMSSSESLSEQSGGSAPRGSGYRTST